MRFGAAQICAVALACLPVQGHSAALAAELMARLLLASDLAEMCPHIAQRKGGKDRKTFIADGVITLINDYDVTMTDFAILTHDMNQEDMGYLKRELLAARGIEASDRREVCFFTQQILGGDDEIGRYLERR